MIFYDLAVKKDVIDNHYLNLFKENEKNIKDCPIETIKNFLSRNFKSILIEKPDKIKDLDSQYKELLKSLNKKDKSLARQLIGKIFNYDNFIEKKVKKYDAYDLAKKLDVRVCLYCNRQYTLIVKKGSRRNEHIIRPEFDHFFAKSEYPLLALSIYNLIPSCHICNSTLKGKVEFRLEDHLHPYIDDCLPHYKYCYKPYDIETILGNNTNLEVEIKTNDRKIRNSANLFKLEEIFSGHSEELKDLFDIRYRFSESYLEQLFKTYKHLGISYEETYKIAFGVHYLESDFGKRPFSKLKKDILKELQVIK